MTRRTSTSSEEDVLPFFHNELQDFLLLTTEYELLLDTDCGANGRLLTLAVT